MFYEFIVGDEDEIVYSDYEKGGKITHEKLSINENTRSDCCCFRGNQTRSHFHFEHIDRGVCVLSILERKKKEERTLIIQPHSLLVVLLDGIARVFLVIIASGS